jgi:hypothetical protein
VSCSFDTAAAHAECCFEVEEYFRLEGRSCVVSRRTKQRGHIDAGEEDDASLSATDSRSTCAFMLCGGIGVVLREAQQLRLRQLFDRRKRRFRLVRARASMTLRVRTIQHLLYGISHAVPHVAGVFGLLQSTERLDLRNLRPRSRIYSITWHARLSPNSGLGMLLGLSSRACCPLPWVTAHLPAQGIHGHLSRWKLQPACPYGRS